MMRFSLLLGFLLVVSTRCWETEQLVNSVIAACPPSNFICPREDFGHFDGPKWVWDKDSIANSPEAIYFLRLRSWNLITLEEMKLAYCCRGGKCLLRCGIMPRVEIHMIKTFPEDIMEVFELGIDEIDKHREFVEEYIRETEKNGAPKHVPAELEDFFDAVHKWQHTIRRAMIERQRTRALEAI
ncbi:unnamed protein product [Caenorhabditis nigoni]|uniref:Uncharacterized protein n=1 Tax=Caenorhabditis nigoni TaxID=1611254 RepID=A0A2G5SPG2_9PELO|nr:hypothetical protein B9Z55_023231 [Caenorhabditis nigoni]